MQDEEFKQEERIAWSTEKIDQLMQQIEDGYKPRNTPFYDGNPLWRKGFTVFDYTPEEIEEIKKCASDVTYYANKYCNVMTDEGVQKIKLRDYQTGMLDHMHKNRYSCILSARQSGKCLVANTEAYLSFKEKLIPELITFNTSDNINISDNKKMTMNELYYFIKLYNKNLSLIDKIKFNLYKFLKKCQEVKQKSLQK